MSYLKRIRYYGSLVCCLLTLGAGGAVAQDSPVARKVGEVEPKYLRDFRQSVLRLCAEMSEEETGARVYVIGYDGRQRLLSSTKYSLRAVTQYVEVACHLPAERIETTRGGLRRAPALEFWIVPEGATSPEPTPPQPRKTRGLEHKEPGRP